MSEAEIAELYMMSVDHIKAEFEFWLTISFGVLIATHVTRESISIQLQIAMCFLYLAASAIAILNTIASIIQVVTYLEMVPEYVNAGRDFDQIAAIARITVYVIGTTSVSVLVFKYKSWTSRMDA